ncbi:ARP2/3_complex_subunit_-_putative [Leishmania major strain Friedlin]|nr:ARP2/3_complex_subunit_-_putative [Leishmania major strain Friedlin]
MTVAKQPYYDCVERTLLVALCLPSFAFDVTQGCTVPEVELVPPDTGTGAPPSSFLVHCATAHAALRCHALRLQWSSGDECFIEASCDSTRVSFWFAAAHQPGDALSAQLLNEYMAFFCSHSAATGALPILRCIPVRRTSAGKPAADAAGRTAYDVSFLVLAEHVCGYGRQHLARSILAFAQEVEAAVASLKVSLNARRRAAAQAFFALPA